MTNQEFIESIRLENEEWRDIVGYEGYYMVSSLGRVASVFTEIYYKNRGKPRRVERQIKQPVKAKFGKDIYYNSVILYKNGEKKSMRVHRLVAIAFIPNPYRFNEVDHIDRNGLNNHIENLRWCTHSMNMLNEKTRVVCSDSQRGKSIPSLYHPVAQILNNKIICTFGSLKEASAMGFSSSAISSVCSGRKHSHKGYNWAYLENCESLTKQEVKELSSNA